MTSPSTSQRTGGNMKRFLVVVLLVVTAKVWAQDSDPPYRLLAFKEFTQEVTFEKLDSDKVIEEAKQKSLGAPPVVDAQSVFLRADLGAWRKLKPGATVLLPVPNLPAQQVNVFTVDTAPEPHSFGASLQQGDGGIWLSRGANGVTGIVELQDNVAF